MSNTKITIYDVARKADVSLATVSRVLNNPNRVKEKTRNRVLGVIKELGYRPNAIARGLASRKSTNVGLIVPTFARTSISEMANGIADIADKYSYSVFLNVTHNEHKLQTDSWENMIASQVDGVLLASDQMNEEEIDRLLSESVPTVLLASRDKQGRVPAVLIDYEAAAYEATKKLIDSGNKNVAFLTGTEGYMKDSMKKVGYEKAIKEAKMTPRILAFNDKLDTLVEEFRTFFNKEAAPDAVLADRDSLAIMFMNAAIDAGIKVPTELEVIGFQNTPTTLMSRPQLSTVIAPTYDIGAVAMRLLTKLMTKEEVEEEEVILPHSFVWRGSTK